MSDDPKPNDGSKSLSAHEHDEENLRNQPLVDSAAVAISSGTATSSSDTSCSVGNDSAGVDGRVLSVDSRPNSDNKKFTGRGTPGQSGTVNGSVEESDSASKKFSGRSDEVESALKRRRVSHSSSKNPFWSRVGAFNIPGRPRNSNNMVEEYDNNITRAHLNYDVVDSDNPPIATLVGDAEAVEYVDATPVDESHLVAALKAERLRNKRLVFLLIFFLVLVGVVAIIAVLVESPDKTESSCTRERGSLCLLDTGEWCLDTFCECDEESGRKFSEYCKFNKPYPCGFANHGTHSGDSGTAFEEHLDSSSADDLPACALEIDDDSSEADDDLYCNLNNDPTIKKCTEIS